MASTPVGENAHDLEPVVEHHDVSGRTGLEFPEVGPPGDPCRHSARGGESSVNGRAERYEIPDGLDHRHGAPGEHAVGSPRDAVLDFEVDAGKRVAAVAGAGRGDRVGDERDSPAGGLPDEPRRVVGEMDAVEDDLDDDVARDERRACKSRLTSGERTHGVEDVRHRLRSVREGVSCLDGGRVRVAARNRHAVLPQQLHQRVRALELGRERDVAHRPRGE